MATQPRNATPAPTALSVPPPPWARPRVYRDMPSAASPMRTATTTIVPSEAAATEPMAFQAICIMSPSGRCGFRRRRRPHCGRVVDVPGVDGVTPGQQVERHGDHDADDGDPDGARRAAVGGDH